MAITTIADYSYLNDVYNSAPLPYPQINIPVSLDAGCTMEIQNYSPFVLQIYSGKTLIESLPPYSWLICNYTDKATANIVSPASLPLAAGAFISTNVMPQKLARLRGDFTLPLAQTVNTPVITPTGSTLAVAGSMNVANVVSATITQASGTTLAISSVGSITENVTTSANVVNEVLNTFGSLSTLPTTTSISDLASGSSVYLTFLSFSAGYYDKVVFEMRSSSAILNDYQFNIVQQRYQEGGGASWTGVSPSLISPANASFDNVNADFLSTPLLLTTEFVTNEIVITVENITSSTITSDTITCTAYLQYASTTVDNDAMSPAQMQESYQMTQTALGSFTVSGTSFTGTTAAQYTQTFPTDNLKTMHFMISVTNATGLSSTCQLQIALKSTMSSGGMLYDIGETNNYPAVFSIDGNANITWDNSVTPQMSSAYPYLALAIYLNNSSSTATTASCDVSITAMVNS